jgi:hypothetical protein
VALNTHFCCQNGDVWGKVYYRTLLHEGYRLKGIRLVALAENHLEDLIDRDGRDDNICRFLKRPGKEGGVGTIRKVFKPAGGSIMFIIYQSLFLRWYRFL